MGDWVFKKQIMRVRAVSHCGYPWQKASSPHQHAHGQHMQKLLKWPAILVSIEQSHKKCRDKCGHVSNRWSV